MPQNKKAMFLCSPYCELEMPGEDAGLLVVPGGVPGELGDFGGEVPAVVLVLLADLPQLQVDLGEDHGT